MKRTVALFLSLLFVFGTVSVGAEEMYSATVSEDIEYATDIWRPVPLAEPMRKLGYEVSYKDGIVTSSKKYETQEVEFVIDVPKAIFYYTVNGEKFDGTLGSPPKIYNGITYVDTNFYNFYVSKFEDVDFVDERNYETWDLLFSIYTFDNEKKELEKTYGSIVEEYEKFEIDLKSEYEANVDVTFDTKISCEKLGISVVGGGEVKGGVYVNPTDNISSVEMKGDVSGIYNIIKLAAGKPLDEVGELNFSLFADKNGTYTKDNLMTLGHIGDKWIYTPGNLDTTGVGTRGDMVALCDMFCYAYGIEGEEKEGFYRAFTNLLPMLQKKVSFEEKDGKVYVKSEYNKEDIRECAKLFFDEFSTLTEEEITIFNKFFDESDFSIVSSEIYEKGKIVSSDGDVKIKMQINVPEVEIPVVAEINMKVNISGGESGVIKEAPKGNKIYSPEVV